MEAAYGRLLFAVLVERALNSFLVIFAVLVGTLSKTWIHVAIASLAVAGGSGFISYVSNFSPVHLLIK
jgi:hypothetical protein